MSDDRPRPGSPFRRASTDARPEEVSFIALLNVSLRNRRRIVLWMLTIGFIAGVHGLLQPRVFTSQASFIPEGASDTPQMRQMAQQFGISAPTGTEPESPAFYAELVQSREILGQVVNRSLELDGAGPQENAESVEVTWSDLFEIEGDTPEHRRERAIEHLRDRLEVTTREDSGVVMLAVGTPWPSVSHQVTELLLDLVNDFNLSRRQSRASEERSFVSARLDEARSELRAAEEELEIFLEHNRQFEQSPSLVFQAERLERDVRHRQEVVTSLTQALEEARIDEVRTTPVITRVVEPYVPAVPDGRGIVLRTIFGLMFGGLIGWFIAFGREFFRRADGAEDDEEAREFARLRREIGTEVRNPLRFFYSGFSSNDRGLSPDGEGSSEWQASRSNNERT